MKKSTFKKIEKLAKMRMGHKIYAGKTDDNCDIITNGVIAIKTKHRTSNSLLQNGFADRINPQMKGQLQKLFGVNVNDEPLHKNVMVPDVSSLEAKIKLIRGNRSRKIVNIVMHVGGPMYMLSASYLLAVLKAMGEIKESFLLDAKSTAVEYRPVRFADDMSSVILCPIVARLSNAKNIIVQNHDGELAAEIKFTRD